MRGGRFTTTVRRKRLRSLVAVTAPLALAEIVFFAQGWVADDRYALLFLLAVALYGALLLRFERRTWKTLRGSVRATEVGLFIEDRLEVPRPWIRRPMVHRVNGRWVARLVHDNLRIVDVETSSEEEAAELLLAMHLDPPRSVAEYVLQRGTWGSALRALVIRLVAMLGIGGSALVLGFRWGWPVAYGWQAVASLIVVAHAVRQFTVVAVGPDGLQLRRRLGRSVFFPFADVEGAAVEGNHLLITMRDGTRHVFHGWLRKPRWLPDALHQEVSDLVARINQRVAAHRTEGEAIAAHLTRANRDTRTWLRELTHANDSHASFRAPALPTETLWRIVEDTTAAPSARAGAAIALGTSREAERLGRAAEASASPQLRAALVAIAGDSPDETEALLDALEPRTAKRA